VRALVRVADVEQMVDQRLEPLVARPLPRRELDEPHPALWEAEVPRRRHVPGLQADLRLLLEVAPVRVRVEVAVLSPQAEVSADHRRGTARVAEDARAEADDVAFFRLADELLRPALDATVLDQRARALVHVNARAARIREHQQLEDAALELVRLFDDGVEVHLD